MHGARRIVVPWKLSSCSVIHCCFASDFKGLNSIAVFHAPRDTHLLWQLALTAVGRSASSDFYSVKISLDCNPAET